MTPVSISATNTDPSVSVRSRSSAAILRSRAANCLPRVERHAVDVLDRRDPFLSAMRPLVLRAGRAGALDVEPPGRDARARPELGHHVDHQPEAVARRAGQRQAIALLQHAAVHARHQLAAGEFRARARSAPSDSSAKYAAVSPSLHHALDARQQQPHAVVVLRARGGGGARASSASSTIVVRAVVTTMSLPEPLS